MQTPSDQHHESLLAAFRDQFERQIHALEIRIEHCQDDRRRQAFQKEIAVIAGLQSKFVTVKH